MNTEKQLLAIITGKQKPTTDKRVYGSHWDEVD